MTPRKHAALIKAWADGANIEWKNSQGEWIDVGHKGYSPVWTDTYEYRIKPTPPTEAQLKVEVALTQAMPAVPPIGSRNMHIEEYEYYSQQHNHAVVELHKIGMLTKEQKDKLLLGP